MHLVSACIDSKVRPCFPTCRSIGARPPISALDWWCGAVKTGQCRLGYRTNHIRNAIASRLVTSDTNAPFFVTRITCVMRYDCHSPPLNSNKDHNKP